MKRDRTGVAACAALALSAAMALAAAAQETTGRETAGRETARGETAALSQAVAGLARTPDEAARIAAVTAPTADFSKAETFETRSAGAATLFRYDNRDAFSWFSSNMAFERQLDFRIGDGLFERPWVSAPASTIASDGLGPIYNARSCQQCHVKDGRGHPPANAEDSRISMFLRVSIPEDLADFARRFDDVAFATVAEPVYGSQLQDLSLPGHAAEARMEIVYEEEVVALSGGETVSLRRPIYRAADLGYGPLHAQAMLSPRVAPPMIGLGLLEAIPEAELLARADPDDADGDGISGRANRVWSPALGREAMGRFGLKAGAATVADQSSGAFAGDMGLSTPLHPAPHGECTEAQTACRAAVHGDDAEQGGFEVSPEALDLVVFYARNLAVPARRGVDEPEVLAGKAVFYETGCASCHTPKHVTARYAPGVRDEQSFQLIWPYTDLLLHDMGEGLADGRPEAQASGREWRTPPLWGIGLTETVNGHTFFLHDGRARGLLEAIIWHGGEAQAARDRVVAMPPEDRAALIRFLESL